MFPAIRNGSGLETRPVNRIESFFDRVLNEAFPFVSTSTSWPGMPLSLWEDDERVVVELEMPGVAEQDLDITAHRGLLVVRGERRAEQGRRYAYNGRWFGRFERTIPLPEAVDADQAQASLDHGVLRISFPKNPEARPKKIALRPAEAE